MEHGKRRDIIDLGAEIISSASVVGHKEKCGPLGDCFDLFDRKDSFGQSTWESSESEMQRLALIEALRKNDIMAKDIDALLAGDLLNQCVAATYGLSGFRIPYLGLYGACSTIAEALILASAFCSYGVYGKCACVTSSHNCSAEMQFRMPLEYGGQRPQSAQWTVTGAGAFIVGTDGASDEQIASNGVLIRDALVGRICDMGLSDANNMGAAMAPAARDSLFRYFTESDSVPSDYDMILTGDLGYEGSRMLTDLLFSDGYDISENHTDCGILIYSKDEQDVHSGGSGCGCSAVVLASYVIPKIMNGDINNLLFIGTGALMSPSSVKQGRTIPGIAHLLHITSKESGAV